ncbi:hypothetical protein [Novipirellula caenicola]|uniref:hypothetical protein n=1 Tax=Novipirellula caenicola TaxID=1536901 RepID=UPI0031E4EE0A
MERSFADTASADIGSLVTVAVRKASSTIHNIPAAITANPRAAHPSKLRTGIWFAESRLEGLET